MFGKIDLALFTVTLKHSKTGLRSKPYYKELSQHFRNALKYGSFKKIISGGFYNTEHTYGKNGHHIHRHALILIPRSFDVRTNFNSLENELRDQWKSRTGGSFQIDLTPIGSEKDRQGKIVYVPSREEVVANIGKYLMEVTKYITKRNEVGTIDFEIIKAVEINNRSKFYGRFGILHRVKELKMNRERDEVEAEVQPERIRTLFIGTAIVERDRRKPTKENKNKPRTPINYHFKDISPMRDVPEDFGRFGDSMRFGVYSWRQEKWNKVREGFDVEKWKEQKTALKTLQNRLENRSVSAGIKPQTNFIPGFHSVISVTPPEGHFGELIDPF